MTAGRLITIEGQDGSGKTTLAKALAASLEESGVPTLLTRQPGDSDIGQSIRSILLHGSQLDVWTEAFLFLAERRRHCATIVQPALQNGTWVVCDRFADSTLAYQGHAGGADLETLRTLNQIATQGLTPDLTLLLDLEPKTALQRLNNPNRIDRMPIEYHERVRQGFLSEARRESHRWRILDASRSPDIVLQEALRLTADALGLEAILTPGGDQP